MPTCSAYRPTNTQIREAPVLIEYSLGISRPLNLRLSEIYFCNSPAFIGYFSDIISDLLPEIPKVYLLVLGICACFGQLSAAWHIGERCVPHSCQPMS